MGLSRVLDFGEERRRRRYRRSLEIVRDMLSIASVRVKKTRIMYQANLSYRQMEKYFSSLLVGGLVACDDDSCYLITRKGVEFLQLYEDYLERRRRLGEEVQGVRKDRLLLENMCLNNEGNSKRLAGKKEVLVDVEAK